MVDGGYLYPPRAVVSGIVAHGGEQREVPEAKITQRLVSVGMDRGSRHARRRAGSITIRRGLGPRRQLNGKADELFIVYRGVSVVETGLIVGVLWSQACSVHGPLVSSGVSS